MSDAATTYTCRWCGQAGDGRGRGCTHCGAPIDVRAVTTRSGWTELPAIADMARLQFGQSHCQIEGLYVPVADMNLAPSDGVYFSHHMLLWMDTAIRLEKMPMKGAWNRVMAGLPVVMLTASGPGHIAFSRDLPGEMVALPLRPGQAIDVAEHHFVVATNQIAYDYFATNIYYVTGSGDDRETHYPVGRYVDRFWAAGDQPGLLLLHAGGNAFVRTLAEGEAILVQAEALLYKDPAVQMHLHVEHPRSPQGGWLSRSMRHLWLRLWGPGRVAIQSSYHSGEDPGWSMNSLSQHTEHRW